MYWKFALSYLTNYNLKTDSINTEKKYLIVFKKKLFEKKSTINTVSRLWLDI